MDYLGIYNPTQTPTEILAILLKESMQIIIISTVILLTTILILVFWDIFSEPKQPKY